MRELADIRTEELTETPLGSPPGGTPGGTIEKKTNIKATPQISKATLAANRASADRAAKAADIRAHAYIAPFTDIEMHIDKAAKIIAASTQSTDSTAESAVFLDRKSYFINSTLILDIGKLIALRMRSINEIASSISEPLDILTTPHSLIAQTAADATYKYMLIAQEMGLTLRELSKANSSFIAKLEGLPRLDLKYINELIESAEFAAHNATALLKKTDATVPEGFAKTLEVINILNNGITAAHNVSILAELITRNIRMIHIHGGMPIITGTNADLSAILKNTYALVDYKAHFSRSITFSKYSTLFTIYNGLLRAETISINAEKNLTPTTDKLIFAKMLAASATDDATIADIMRRVLAYLPRIISVADLKSKLVKEAAEVAILATDAKQISASALAITDGLTASDNVDEAIKIAITAQVIAANAAAILTKIARDRILEATKIHEFPASLYSRLFSMFTNIIAYQDTESARIKPTADSIVARSTATISVAARNGAILAAENIIMLEGAEPKLITREAAATTAFTIDQTILTNPSLTAARDSFIITCREAAVTSKVAAAAMGNEALINPASIASNPSTKYIINAIRWFEDACLKVSNYQLPISPSTPAAAMILAVAEVIWAAEDVWKASDPTGTIVDADLSSAHTKLELACKKARTATSAWEDNYIRVKTIIARDTPINDYSIMGLTKGERDSIEEIYKIFLDDYKIAAIDDAITTMCAWETATTRDFLASSSMTMPAAGGAGARVADGVHEFPPYTAALTRYPTNHSVIHYSASTISIIDSAVRGSESERAR